MSFYRALTHIRIPGGSPEPPAPDPLTAHRGLVDPDASPTLTPAPPGPPRVSETAEMADLWRVFGPEYTARLTEHDRITEAAVLDELAERVKVLGSPLSAAQSLYAPHLMEEITDA